MPVLLLFSGCWCLNFLLKSRGCSSGWPRCGGKGNSISAPKGGLFGETGGLIVTLGVVFGLTNPPLGHHQLCGTATPIPPVVAPLPVTVAVVVVVVLVEVENELPNVGLTGTSLPGRPVVSSSQRRNASLLSSARVANLLKNDHAQNFSRLLRVAHKQAKKQLTEHTVKHRPWSRHYTKHPLTDYFQYLSTESMCSYLSNR